MDHKGKTDTVDAIILKHVRKNYTLHHEKPTLVEKFIRSKTESFLALANIDLEIKKGEKVGIIGPNGSGKTTLLKLISGISNPTSGFVNVNGRVVSIIDLEAGLQEDLTGEQNIYLQGALLGMSKREISQTISAIIRFAGIGRFIDAPLFTYSQGMKLRLSFAVAAHANPDILVLDEAIGVGDEAFQKKSRKKIQEFFHKGKTVLISTHWLDFIYKNCTRIITLRNGAVISDKINSPEYK